MIGIEMSDVIGVLQTCRNYLIALGIIILAALIILIASRKLPKQKRSFLRWETVLAMLLGIVIMVNAIVFGPMYTLVSLTMGSGTVTEETTAEAEAAAEEISEEGFVLLKNEQGFLPLKDTKKLNLFGWAASNPIYGGSG